MDFSLTTLYVLPTGNLVADGFKRENLKATQFGVFNSRYKAVTTAGEAKKSPYIVFGQGRIENLPGLTHKYSDKVSTGSLIEWYKSNGNPTAKNQITYAGFDGVDNTKTIKAGCDEQYSLTVRARSLYIDTVWAYGLTRTVTVTTPCCADCGNDCETVDPRIVANAFAEKINAEPMLSKFVVATPVFECTTPATAETVIPTVTYCTSFCDNGDAQALAIVQSQFPNDLVARSARVGSISTYQIERLASQAAPASVVVSLPVRLAVCDVCPATYTLVADQTLYIVETPLDGSEALATGGQQQTFATAISTTYSGNTGTFLENTGGSARVLVSVDSADPALVALLADIVTEVGDEGASCTPPAGTAVAWASCDTGYKVQRTLTITLADDCLPATTLLDLQALYPNATVTLAESANCNSRYQLVQTSETIHQDCEFGVPPVFAAVQGYNGIEWVVVPVVLTGAGCQAGVKIEGKSLDKYGNPCDPIAFPYEFDKLTFEVFAYKGAATSQDYSNVYDRCDNIPITTVQKSDFVTGSGDEIFELEKRYNSYQSTGVGKHIYHNATWNGGFSRYSVADKFYDVFYLKFASPDLLTWDASTRQDETVIIAVPQGEGADIEAFLLGYFGIEKFTAGVLRQSA